MDLNLHDREESSIIPSMTLYSGIIGISLFTWSFYNYSSFRRNVIQKMFDTYDYCYDLYHKLWYDEKIRINNIDKNHINIKEIHEPFLNKLLDSLTMSNTPNMSNTSEDVIEETEAYEEITQESYEGSDEGSDEENINKEVNREEDNKENNKENYEGTEILDFIKKYDFDHHDHILHKFLTNDINFKSIHIKEKTYYVLYPDLSENKDNEYNNFTKEHILESPWLAVSLVILTIDYEIKEYDITESLKKFWIENNNIPVHVEYYDFWVDILLNETGISKNNILSKDKIKKFHLSVINDVGDFKNYENVLIVPRKENFKIIEFPVQE